MKTLTKYTNFSDLKAAAITAEVLSKSDKENLRQYELLLQELSKKLADSQANRLKK